jgi:hypothetical protein
VHSRSADNGLQDNVSIGAVVGNGEQQVHLLANALGKRGNAGQILSNEEAGTVTDLSFEAPSLNFQPAKLFVPPKTLDILYRTWQLRHVP